MGENWFKNPLSVFNKKKPENTSENNDATPDRAKMGPNDLVLLMLNNFGFHVSRIEDITYEQIKGTDLAGVASASNGGSRVTLENFLNQKGVYPEHFLMIGELMVAPNYEEVVKKTYQNVDEVVLHDPFASLGTLFDRIKENSRQVGADTFIVKNNKTGIAYSFPKKFAEGFYHLMKHLEKLNYEGQVLDKYKENNMPQKYIDEQEKKLAQIDTAHGPSKYLQTWFEQQQRKQGLK